MDWRGTVEQSKKKERTSSANFAIRNFNKTRNGKKGVGRGGQGRLGVSPTHLWEFPHQPPPPPRWGVTMAE